MLTLSQDKLSEAQNLIKRKLGFDQFQVCLTKVRELPIVRTTVQEPIRLRITALDLQFIFSQPDLFRWGNYYLTWTSFLISIRFAFVFFIGGV